MADSLASTSPDTKSENDGPLFNRSSKVVDGRVDGGCRVGCCCGKRESSVVVVAYVRSLEM